MGSVNMVNMKPDLPDQAVKEIASACRKADEAIAHRDEVLARWAQGYSLRDVAEAGGKDQAGKLRITHSGIARIVKRGTL